MKQEELTICAFRYCLGRSTYVVSEMCDHLRNHWDEICPAYQGLIKQEVQDAIDRGCCGMKMDCEDWAQLLEDIENAEENIHRDG